MAGGLIQLAAYGAENKYLMGNPQITFFKIVFKRHTNFSIESINLPFDGIGSISETSQSIHTLSVKIPRLGDLLGKIFLKVKIPDIISSIHKKFKWVKNLGEVMINNVSLFIGGSKIESFPGEWIHIYHKSYLDKSKRELYDILIGNTPNLYNADERVSNELLEIIAILKKDNQEENIYQSNNNLLLEIIKKLSNHNSNHSPYYNPKEYSKQQGLGPSILGRNLYIPIPFYFTKNIGLSLPLLSLQYHDIEIKIEMNPIMNLFTILDNDNLKQIRRRPNPLKNNQKLSYFVYNHNINNRIPKKNKNCNIKLINDIFENENIDDQIETDIQNLYNCGNYQFEISLETFFIFLDDDERKHFTEKSHEYLIEQIQVREGEGYSGESNSFNMNLYNPVKEIFWIFYRNDLYKYNIWFNYTNLIDDKNPFWNQESYLNEYETNSKYLGYNNDNWLYFRENIMTQAKITFNSLDRIEFKDSIYFNYLYPYLTHSNFSKGIYNYSFALEPEKFQPSGCVNMSMISSVSLDFNTQIPPIDPEVSKVLNSKNLDEKKKKMIMNNIGIIYNNNRLCVKDKVTYKYTYNLRCFIINYNILTITSGMAGLKYTS